MRLNLYRVSIVFILGVCYSLTIAPGLTWAHFSADGGDLIAATAVNGVPHPGGYPLYLMLAKLFQFLPFGSLAFRTNLFSAACTISASLLLFNLIHEQIKEKPFQGQLAFLGALAYGLAPAVWSQSLVTEVYALHGFLTVLCLYVFLKPDYPEWSRGFIFGLAATNHIISVLLFPLLLFYGDLRKIVLRFTGVLCGTLLYFTLPLRALANPPVNWGNPSTLQGFIWLLWGGNYSSYAFQLSVWDVLDRLRAASGFALDQFTALGLLLAFYGVFSLRISRFFVATLWSSLVFLLFSVVYASYDSHVYLIVLWLCIAIWISIGLGELFQVLHNRALRSAQILSFAIIAVLLLRIPFTFPKVNVSTDARALEFIALATREIPEGALVFVTGDEQVFSLWYAQFALHQREDAIIIAEGLLQFEWYRQNLQHTYPVLRIPETTTLQPFDLITANLDRRICYISPDCIKCV
jgi:hypothetical protein